MSRRPGRGIRRWPGSRLGGIGEIEEWEASAEEQVVKKLSNPMASGEDECKEYSG